MYLFWQMLIQIGFEPIQIFGLPINGYNQGGVWLLIVWSVSGKQEVCSVSMGISVVKINV